MVIPTYNRPTLTCRAIDSVLAQTFTDFELIVVNDASTDGTADILGTYERAGSARVVTHERNRGLSAARNSGIRHARGTYVTFLDADDVWRAEKLAYQMSILEDAPGLTLRGPAPLTGGSPERERSPLIRRPPALAATFPGAGEAGHPL